LEVGVDGYADVHGELVDGFEDEGVAREGEGVEVALVVVEDHVEDAGLAEVEEVGGEAAGEAEEGAVEHLAQSYGEHLGDEGVGLCTGELAQGLAKAELYGVGFVAYEAPGFGEIGLGEGAYLPHRLFEILCAADVEGLFGVDGPVPQSGVQRAAEEHLLVRLGGLAQDLARNLAEIAAQLAFLMGEANA
jgi:hypothetical protein